MLITYQSNPAVYSSRFNTQKRPIKFGDAVFERNKKFADSIEIPQHTFKEQQKLQLQSNPAKTIADFLVASSKSLYDPTGRVILGGQALALALKNAGREYKLRQNEVRNHPSLATETAKDLAGIKLANAQLAADTSEASNQKAFKLLSDSLNRLSARGYHQKEQVSPVFIHGLYNRGTYAFNNDLRQANLNYYGTWDTQHHDETFEGLLVCGMDKNRSKNYKTIKEGLPYLEQAIELADTLPDHHLAKSEYQIAKGEIHHALAHLVAFDSELYYGHSQEARSAFDSALHTLQNVDPSQRTPHHKELIKNLVEVKIPHLCEPIHRANPVDAGAMCGAMQIRGSQLSNKPISSMFSDILADLDIAAKPQSVIPEYPYSTESESTSSNAPSSTIAIKSISESQPFPKAETIISSTDEGSTPSPLQTVTTSQIPRWKRTLDSWKERLNLTHKQPTTLTE